MRSVFAFALLAVGLSYAQTDSLPACDATMRAYRAQFEALMYSGMTPVAGYPGTLIRTTPASEFSLSYLMAAPDDVKQCAMLNLTANRSLPADLTSVSNSVDGMLARRLLNYVVKHPERVAEIDAATPAVQAAK
jgi:hypothetical protein